jgi:signal transduction histidine kinase
MIRRRFLLYFLALSAITIVATVVFETWSFRRAINHSLDQNLLFARSVARVVGGLVDDEKVQLKRLLDVAVKPDVDAKALAAELANVRLATLDNDGVALFDQTRQLIAADTSPAGLPPSEVLLGLLRRAQTSGAPVVTDLWRGLDKYPRVAIAQGRTTGEGKDKQWRAAVVYVRLDGANFQRVFSYFLVNAHSRLQLLDATGVALFSTQADERYISAVHGTYFTDKVRLGGEAQMQCHSCHQKGNEAREPGEEAARETEITTVAPVPGTEWTVTVREGKNRLFAPMVETVYASTGLVALIFGCFVGYYALLSRRVLRPMRHLTETANALALEHGASVYGHDEFSQLAHSFEVFRARPNAPQEPPVIAVRATQPIAPMLDIRHSLMGLAEGVAASKSVSSVLLHLRGGPLGGDFFSAHGVTLRAEGAIGELLESIAAGRTQVPVADLEARGVALEGAHGTRLFYVQRIRVPETLEGELWIGVPEGSESVARWLGPTMAVIGGQVQSLVERSLLYEQLRQEQEHKNRMLRHLFEAEAEERKHIAREIHDETAQELTALSLQLETMQTDGRPEIEAQLEKAKLLVRRILDGINRLVRRLRPAVLDDMGLVEAVRATGQNILGSAGLKFTLEVVGGDIAVPKDVENMVYRVFQEAVTNIVRHAQAKKVGMRLHVEAGSRDDPGRLMGWIEDDGRGMDPMLLTTSAPRPRWGLLGMRERIVQMGGTVEFTTAPGGGLRIVFDVPFAAGRG